MNLDIDTVPKLDRLGAGVDDKRLQGRDLLEIGPDIVMGDAGLGLIAGKAYKPAPSRQGAVWSGWDRS